MKVPLVLVPAAIILLIAALVAVGWFSLLHNITPEVAAQIKPGMTRPQVEAMLGGPPGLYFRWREVTPAYPVAATEGTLAGEHQWIADDFAVRVLYDPTDRVLHVQSTQVLVHGSRGFFLDGKNVMPDFVRSWLGWDDVPIDVDVFMDVD